MSSASLRYRSITLSFLPYQRDHRLTKNFRALRVRASRRRAKRMVRDFMSRIKKNAYARTP
jgi:hypothetical protein